MKRAIFLTFPIVAAMPRAAWAQASAPIANLQTGLVMIPRGLSSNEGTQLITWYRGTSPVQNWSIIPTGMGWFKLVNAGNGMCVGVAGGSTNDGAKIVQWHDDGTLNQQWRWLGRGGGRTLLVNRGSGKVIGVAGSSTVQGTPLIQWHEDGHLSQFWRLQPFAAVPASAQPTAPESLSILPAERAAMEAAARQFMGKYNVPGFSVAVGSEGRLIYQNAFGVADRAQGVPVTPGHLFRIASVTKPITSATIFSLIEKGSLRLGDRVFGPGAILGTDYGGPPYGRYIEQITLEQLLTHTAGGWQNDGTDPMFQNLQMNHQQLIAWTLRNVPLKNQPGTHYAYSNFGYCVLGRVIEKVTGQPYAAYVSQAILRPSGITDMVIAGNTLAQRRPNEVVYYGQGSGDNPYSLNVTRMDSHGGWLARPADLVLFAMHVGGFQPPPSLLTSQSIRTMTTGSSANSGYAKGWLVNSSHNWWHNGILSGTMTIMVRTHSGFFWAGFANTYRWNSAMDSDLDALLWTMVSKVSSWNV